MSKPKNPILHFGPRYCRYCKTNSIEIFDYFNNPMGYATIADSYMKYLPAGGILDKKVVYKMRCRRCGKEYRIRNDNGYPVPDLYPDNENYAEFIRLFSSFEK